MCEDKVFVHFDEHPHVLMEKALQDKTKTIKIIGAWLFLSSL